MPDSDPSDQSDQPDQPDRSDSPLLPKHGGYRRLRSFQTAQLVYDGTVIFCGRFIDRRSRTRDQMVQAARSGVQNIAEGSVASGTSKKTEIKLTNVARASLDELLLDLQDFLRQRGLRVWPKNSPEALAVRHRHECGTTGTHDPYELRTVPAEIAANTLICLGNQASFLLHRQLNRLESEFLEHGGITERLYRLRRAARDAQAPKCPLCDRSMVLRKARHGRRAGEPFWGCSGYPACTGTRPA